MKWDIETDANVLLSVPSEVVLIYEDISGLFQNIYSVSYLELSSDKVYLVSIITAPVSLGPSSSLD